MKSLKCLLGSHKWEKWSFSEYPICGRCDTKFDLTWAQCDEIHRLEDEIRKLKKQINEITRTAKIF